MKALLEKGLNKIFNRLTITVLLILVQMGWFAVLLLKLADYASWISILFTVIAILMALFIVWRDDNPAYKVGWIMIISIVPILGVAMYAFFGNKRPAKSIKVKLERQEAAHSCDLKPKEDLTGKAPKRLLSTLNYVAEKGPYPAWTGTSTKYYSSGEAAYAEMLKDLKQAKHFIFWNTLLFPKELCGMRFSAC